jgi:putative serine protease PepD
MTDPDSLNPASSDPTERPAVPAEQPDVAAPDRQAPDTHVPDTLTPSAGVSPTEAPVDGPSVDTPDEQPVAVDPIDDAPVTGPLHTVPGGPDWQSRPSGALRATPSDQAWSQAAAGPVDPNAQTWFGSRPGATGATGATPRPYPVFTGSFQQPATGAVGQPGQPGWHQTRTDLPPLGVAGMPATGTPATTTEKPKRRKGTLVAATTVALALVAGFGGGVLATNLTDSKVNTAADSSLTQTSAAAPVSDVSTTGTSVEAVAKKVLPSVVSIVSTSDSSAGEGSGVILTKDGLILTNNHVVEGASNLTVRFNDGTTATAKLVGADTTDDLAVIKAEGVSNLSPATLGTSSNLVVGQQVVAVGSPLGLSATVTTGIVSALNRPVRTADSEDQQQQQQQQDPFGGLGGQGNGQTDPNQDQQGQSTSAASGTVLNAIQTDAAINPGNSGGPLVDMNGNVIGINSAIASLSDSSSGQSGSIGVGFSIPIDQAHRIAQEIINTGKAQHAVLGASVRDNTTSETAMPTGALIASVVADGGAAKAGLKEGDVVTKVGDLPVDSADALIAAIRSQNPGGTVKITYVRGSDTATVDVTLGATSS